MKSALNMFGSTKNPDAYRCYIYGINASMKLNFSTAVNMLSQAVSIDSNFLAANLLLAVLQINTNQIEEGRELFMRKYKQKDLLPLKQKLNLNILYSNLFEGPQEIIKNCRELLAIDDQDPLIHGGLADAYSLLEQYDNAIPEFEKEIKIYESWDSIPSSVIYTQLGLAYHKTNLYKKEQKLYNIADHLYHGIDSYNTLIISSLSLDFRQAVLYLAEGKKKKAEQYINKHIADLKAGLFSEGDINTNIGSIYLESGLLDKAEEYLRKARSMESENPVKMNTLAYFLIDKEININEGMELIDKALESNPDEYDWLDTKGWGLYKLGKYHEAMKLLQKADSLKPIYSQDIYMHLEAAKKAVAILKNN
jgi:tetratricopeptide (TPR) repeat protein